jgi:hypothetical protein
MAILDPQLSDQIEVGEPVPERRRSRRHERATPAWLSAASGSDRGNGFNVKIKDLSLHGAGFIADRALSTRDTHWMVIADQSLRLSTRVRIVSCNKREDGLFDVGGEFY